LSREYKDAITSHANANTNFATSAVQNGSTTTYVTNKSFKMMIIMDVTLARIAFNIFAF